MGAALGALVIAGIVANRGSPVEPVEPAEEIARLRFAQAGEQVEDLAFSPDGRSLATVGRRQLLRVLDTQTGAQRVAVAVNRDTWRVAFSPDGSLIAIAGVVPVQLRRVENGEVAKELTSFGPGLAHDVEFSPDGSQLAVTGGSPTTLAESQKVSARIWSVETGKWLRGPFGHRDNTFGVVVGLSFSADGTVLATANSGGTVLLWDVESGDWIKTLTVDSTLDCMAMHPGGGIIAAGTREDGIVLLDTATGLEIGRLDAGFRNPNSMSFGPGGTRLAVGYSEGQVRLWDIEGEEQIGNLDSDLYREVAVAYSRDGTLLASGERDGTVRVWELAGGGG